MRKPPIALTVLAVTVWLGPSAVAQDEGWVDTHAHLVYLAGSAKGLPDADDYRAAAKELIAEMDRAGVGKALLLNPPSTRQTPQGPKRPDRFVDLVEKTVQSYPGRLYFVGGGDVLQPLIYNCPADRVTREAREEFEREAEALVKRGVRGFGEMAALHLSLGEGHPFEEIMPDHPLFLLLAVIAARHRLPIDLHMDAVPEDMDFPARMERLRKLNPPRLKGNLAAFARLLSHDRKANIVWQHAGTDPLGGMNPARLRELLSEHPNLYVGLRVPFEKLTGKMPQPNSPVDAEGQIRPDWLALFTDFPDRFMIGTDIFVQGAEDQDAHLPQGRPDPYKAFSLLQRLPAELRAKLGRENAERVYGIH